MKNVNFRDIKGALSREEMRKVKGGGSCGFKVPNGLQHGVNCNLSKAEAQSFASRYGGYWCCQSCASNGGSASYC